MKKILMTLALAVSISACANINEKENIEKPKLEAVKDDGTQSEENSNSKESSKDTDEEEKIISDGVELEKHTDKVYEYFDTITTFMAYTEDDEEFDHYKEVLKEELKTYHEFFNSYDTFEGVNNFRTINEMAGKEPVEVDPLIIELIKYSKEMYELTDGKINIAMGFLLGLWHDYRDMSIENPDKAAIPEEGLLVEASKHENIEAIEIDEEKNTVFISDPDVQIDIGAIGKGYATKIIAERLEEEGLKHGILSVGGDDVLIGDNPNSDDSYYTIAITNPDLEDKDEPFSSVVKLRETSVVTSGDYQRYFMVDGKRYHHIIDPATMYPSTKWRSVSVIMDDIARADTISTYLFILDHDEGLEFAKKVGAEVLWIDEDFNSFQTEGWPEVE
ncbi:FAD:protein FMN transferase [uncultured Anaerococcus sp.]|uniref:FAD:protein FMN transferase n=1 Tax=uncultured Anaerococcus sp. TaxID=293428 RepID=UPI0025D10ED2|nr:FAD:protein FMN transferase [uncultured Anaerococcus sp.]